MVPELHLHLIELLHLVHPHIFPATNSNPVSMITSVTIVTFSFTHCGLADLFVVDFGVVPSLHPNQSFLSIHRTRGVCHIFRDTAWTKGVVQHENN